MLRDGGPAACGNETFRGNVRPSPDSDSDGSVDPMGSDTDRLGACRSDDLQAKADDESTGGQRRILQIVWHSMTGACCQLAEAAAAAAREEASSDAVDRDGTGAEVHLPEENASVEVRKYGAGAVADADATDESRPSSDSPPLAGAASEPAFPAAPEGGAGDVIVRCGHAREVSTEDMLAASAYLFVAPENLASMAGVMKDFFDRQYYPLLDRIQGRAAAVIVAAGSDGHGAVRQIERILTGWRLRLAAESLIVRVDAQTPEAILAPKHLSAAQLEPARDLGRALAAGLGMGIF
jgi:hypothetical protein